MIYREFEVKLAELRINKGVFARMNNIGIRTIRGYYNKFGRVQVWVKNLIEAMGSMDTEKREMFIKSRLREINC